MHSKTFYRNLHTRGFDFQMFRRSGFRFAFENVSLQNIMIPDAWQTYGFTSKIPPSLQFCIYYVLLLSMDLGVQHFHHLDQKKGFESKNPTVT